MEGPLRDNRRRSGYEPSDTESDWPESPRRVNRQPGIMGFDQTRSKSPLPATLSRVPSARLEMEAQFTGSGRRKLSKSPYKPCGVEDGDVLPPLHNADCNGGNVCLFSKSERRISPDNRRENLSAFSLSERRKYVSPHRTIRESLGLDNRPNNHDLSRPVDVFNNSKRAASAPRARLRERGQQNMYVLSPLPQDEWDGSHKRFPSVGEINEMVANAQISRGLSDHVQNFESVDSVSPGDIFFSRDFPGFQNIVYPKKAGVDPTKFLPKPPGFSDRNQGSHQANKVNGSYHHHTRTMSQTTRNSSFAESRQSRVSNSSGKTSDSTKKFVESRRKSQGDAWFSCLNKGSCKKTQKSPEKERVFDEASFIEKAVVVESLRPFWVEKHQPASLIGFTCHKQEALLLQQLVSIFC